MWGCWWHRPGRMECELSHTLVTIPLVTEHDVVGARRQARNLAASLRFESQDQSRIATAVSEVARHVVSGAHGGTATFSIEQFDGTPLLQIVVRDRLPTSVGFERASRPPTLAAEAFVGARRLMDRFELHASSSGSVISMGKVFSPRMPALTKNTIAQVKSQLRTAAPVSAFDEVQQQNWELLRVLDELRDRQNDLTRLNLELDETNRGVVALYAELEERADHLRRADQTKSRFLHHVSHEFRTPLNSILALSALLLDRLDGELTSEQQIQMSLIRQAAQDLSDLVNDLLDLAKVEAGRIDLRPSQFEVSTLFGALRGMLRPLLGGQAVSLIFEAADSLPPLFTDEAKVSQILRNFVSNALKFTERGRVVVKADLSTDATAIVFSVTDTGIGIAPEHLELIFEEFAQVEHPIQRNVRGTGLGLPLARKLAALLGGHLHVSSVLGEGSTFTFTVPLNYQPSGADSMGDGPASVGLTEPDTSAPSVLRRPLALVVDDEAAARYVLRRHLSALGFGVIEAADAESALAITKSSSPDLVLLDVIMPERSGLELLADLRADSGTENVPLIVVTSARVDETLTAAVSAQRAELFTKSRLAAETAREELHALLVRLGVARTVLGERR